MRVAACIVAKSPDPTPRIIGLPAAEAANLQRLLYKLVVAPHEITTHPGPDDCFYAAARTRVDDTVWTWLAHYRVVRDSNGRTGGFLGGGLLLADAVMDGPAALRLIDRVEATIAAEVTPKAQVPADWPVRCLDGLCARELAEAGGFLTPLKSGAGLAWMARRSAYLSGIGLTGDALGHCLEILQSGRVSPALDWVATAPSPALAARWEQLTAVEVLDARNVLGVAPSPTDPLEPPSPAVRERAVPPAAATVPKPAPVVPSLATVSAAATDTMVLDRLRALSVQVSQLDSKISDYHRGVRLLRRGVALIGILLVGLIATQLVIARQASTVASAAPNAPKPDMVAEVADPSNATAADMPKSAANAAADGAKADSQARRERLAKAAEQRQPATSVKPKGVPVKPAPKAAPVRQKPVVTKDPVADIIAREAAATERKNLTGAAAAATTTTAPSTGLLPKKLDLSGLKAPPPAKSEEEAN